MKNVIFCLPFVFITFYSSSQSKVDGFYSGEDKGIIGLGLGFEDSKDYFAGTTKTGLTRNLYYANLYGAYGITSDFDVLISIPYMSSNDNSNLQDVSFFAKYRVLKKVKHKQQFELSFALGFSTPLTNYSIGGLNDIGQQATIIESRIVLHYGLKSGWFFTLQSGYSFKFKETPHSLPVTFKTGKATKNWYYDLFYDYQHSFGGIDYLGTPRPQNFREFGVNYHKVGGTVYRPILKQIGIYVNMSYVILGRNVFKGLAYSAGLIYNLKK